MSCLTISFELDEAAVCIKWYLPEAMDLGVTLESSSRPRWLIGSGIRIELTKS